MRVAFELLRIIFFFLIVGGLGAFLLANIYSNNEVADQYSWLGTIAVLLLLFVLYRNKLQFSGWYKGVGRKKLPRKIYVTLIFTSIILFVSPFVLAYLSTIL